MIQLRCSEIKSSIHVFIFLIQQKVKTCYTKTKLWEPTIFLLPVREEKEVNVTVYANQGQEQRLLISDLPSIISSKSQANLRGFTEEFKVIYSFCISYI